MPVPSSAALRAAVLVVMAILALASVVSLAGGPDPIGDAWPLLFGLVLLVWFGAELRQERAEGRGRLLWVGLAAAVLLIAASVGDLLT